MTFQMMFRFIPRFADIRYLLNGVLNQTTPPTQREECDRRRDRTGEIGVRVEMMAMRSMMVQISDNQRDALADWLLSNDLHVSDADTPALLDLAEHGDEADRAFACSRILAQAEARPTVPAWLRGAAGDEKSPTD